MKGKKQKNHSGAKKRFRRTKNGILSRRPAGQSHLMEGKSPARKRRHRRWAALSKGDQARIEKILPNARA